MLSRQCPFCENVNPPSSRFCNACGVKLHAALCPYCGAVNVLAATTCVSCAAELPDASSAAMAALSATADVEAPAHAAPPIEAAPVAEPHGAPPRVVSLDTVPPLAFSVHFDRDHTVKIDRSYDSGAHVNAHHADWTASRTSERRELTSPHPPLPELTLQVDDFLAQGLAPAFDLRTSPAPVAEPPRYRQYAALLGIAIVALLAGSAYYLYHAHTIAEMSALVASGRELKVRDTSTESAPTDTPAATPVAPSPAAAAAPAIPANPQSALPADAQRKLRATGQIGSAEAAATVDAAAARTKSGNAASATPPQGLGPCTDAVAALGLCTRESPTRPRQ